MKLLLSVVLIANLLAFIVATDKPLEKQETIGQKLDGTVDAASEVVQNAADAVKDTAAGAKHKVGAAIDNTKEAVGGAVAATGDVVKDAGKSIKNDNVRVVRPGPVDDKPGDIVVGVRDGLLHASRSVSEDTDDVKDVVVAIVEDKKTNGTLIKENIKDAAQAAENRVVNAGQEIKNAAGDAAQNAGNKLNQAGESIKN